MTIATQNFFPSTTERSPLTLAVVIATVFMVNLRESLDAASISNNEDAAFVYGL